MLRKFFSLLVIALLVTGTACEVTDDGMDDNTNTNTSDGNSNDNSGDE